MLGVGKVILERKEFQANCENLGSFSEVATTFRSSGFRCLNCYNVSGRLSSRLQRDEKLKIGLKIVEAVLKEDKRVRQG